MERIRGSPLEGRVRERWKVHELVEWLRARIVADRPHDMARRAEPVAQGLDLRPGEQDAPALSHGVRLARQVELGRVDREAARPQAVQGTFDEAARELGAAHVLERAEGPAEIESSFEIGGHVVHVHGAEAHVAVEGFAIDELWLEEAIQTRVLAGLAPSRRLA